jgi:ubiquinone/menaquinone biosynthesis C-methylase UbiE
LARHFG